MADSQPNRHIAPVQACAIANSAALFRSPITVLQMGVWLILAISALAGLWVLPDREALMPVVLAPEPKQISRPVSLLKTGSIDATAASQGITILQRSAAPSGVHVNAPVNAPVASGADSANGFAISLGEAQAFSTLSQRFARVAALNGAVFQKLEPRAVFIETSSGLTARLLAGPFSSKDEAANICGILHLPGGIICSAQTFDGDLISRQ